MITLKEAKKLRKRWKACKTDTERIALIIKTKQIRVTLDNDSTTCFIMVDWENISENERKEFEDVYYLECLDEDFGDRGGVETLLNYLGIPFEHC